MKVLNAFHYDKDKGVSSSD
ncbi:hypothetical protein VCHC50A2_3178A, partial [Vibrio cholerae HC-50A2]